MILDLLYEFLDLRTLLVFASFLLVAWYLFGESRFRLPPGPTAWPLIGSFLYVRRGNKALYMRMMDLYREYGPIARLKIGRSINIVFVFGADMIRKAGVEHNDDFKFRPNNIFMANKIFNGKGKINILTFILNLVLSSAIPEGRWLGWDQRCGPLKCWQLIQNYDFRIQDAYWSDNPVLEQRNHRVIVAVDECTE